MDNPKIHWHAVVSQPFDENTYVVWRDDSNACIVVDPGFEPEKIVDFLSVKKLVPEAIFNTHGHGDHIAGNAAMKSLFPSIPLLIGAGDADKLTDPWGNLSAPFGQEILSPPADRLVQQGDEVQAAGIPWHVLETPGHSRGHVAFLCRSVDPWLVLGGDVLFRGSIGRTDFPDGNHGELVAAIHERLFCLPEDTIVLPGHGPATTIGREKISNPFVGLG